MIRLLIPVFALGLSGCAGLIEHYRPVESGDLAVLQFTRGTNAFFDGNVYLAAFDNSECDLTRQGGFPERIDFFTPSLRSHRIQASRPLYLVVYSGAEQCGGMVSFVPTSNETYRMERTPGCRIRVSALSTGEQAPGVERHQLGLKCTDFLGRMVDLT